MTTSDPNSTYLPTGGAAEQLNRKAAGEAYKKVLAGEELSPREQAALKRFEKEKEERLRWQYYGCIPQKHWRKMSGRQAKVINEQAVRYGIPFSGATINLSAVVGALHDFLADNAVRLSRDEDELMQGSASPALERYREERALIVRLDRLERERELLPRDMVRVSMSRIATILRNAGDALQRQCGPAAVEILYEAIEDAQREIERAFSQDTPELNHEPAEPPSEPE